MTIIFVMKFGWNRIVTVGEVVFEISAPIGSHVNENKKKNRKNLKIKIKKKNGLELWRLGSFPQNLAWIHAIVTEEPELMDGRTTDAWSTTVALLTKSSKAKNH